MYKSKVCTTVFESSVVLDGTKTFAVAGVTDTEFESSVVLDGTKTFYLFFIR